MTDTTTTTEPEAAATDDTPAIDSATYSVEDNKLRLYPNRRLEPEEYERVKSAGFKWAPKQELFVAPRWTPGREDLALELAGAIEPEGTTLAERAEMKAARLDTLSGKREWDANSYAAAASAISERFAHGQPILAGHHSQRKAERDKRKMDSANERAEKASRLANYWKWRAEGVERFVNLKSDPRTRANRIKTLLSELRKIQRQINFRSHGVDLWQRIGADDDPERKELAVNRFCEGYTQDGNLSPRGTRDDLKQGKIEIADVIQISIDYLSDEETTINLQRWAAHILGRLGYENAELGETREYTGEIKPALLQTFARTHGADKPKAKKTGLLWTLTSEVDLPLHLTGGESLKELSLSEGKWRDLMRGCDYTPPAPKKKAPPILNFKIEKNERLNSVNQYERGGAPLEYEQIEMTKAQYSKMWNDSKWTARSVDGSFRFRVAMIGESMVNRKRCAVFLTDSKEHDRPAV